MTLATAHLYLVAPARLKRGPLEELIPDLATAGVDIVQLREKEMEADEVVRVARPILEACLSVGIPFIVNDNPEVALSLGAHGVHVGQDDLPAPMARRIVGSTRIVGLSTHAPPEIDEAVGGGAADYIAVGPVFETPTKPGRPAVGLELIRYAAAEVRFPWFAIGGLNSSNLDEVIEAGARRAVVVRAITEADDPPQAASELRALLNQAAR